MLLKVRFLVPIYLPSHKNSSVLNKLLAVSGDSGNSVTQSAEKQDMKRPLPFTIHLCSCHHTYCITQLFRSIRVVQCDISVVHIT